MNGGKGTVFNDDPLMIAATWAMLAIGFLGLGRAKTEEGVGEIGLGQRFCQLRFGRWSGLEPHHPIITHYQRSNWISAVTLRSPSRTLTCDHSINSRDTSAISGG